MSKKRKKTQSNTNPIPIISYETHNTFVKTAERFLELAPLTVFTGDTNNEKEIRSKFEVTQIQESHSLQDLNHCIKQINDGDRSSQIYYEIINKADTILNCFIELRRTWDKLGRNTKNIIAKTFDPKSTGLFGIDIDKINAFRELRSISSAHPLDTQSNGNNYYCEDVRSYSIVSEMLNRPPHDFVVQYRVNDDTETKEKYVLVSKDIVDVIQIIMKHLQILIDEMQQQIIDFEASLRNKPLLASKLMPENDYIAWINALESDVKERYPHLVTKEYSIFDEPRAALQKKFASCSETNYKRYRQYIISNIQDFAVKLQNMAVDENDTSFCMCSEELLEQCDTNVGYALEKIHFYLSNSTTHSFNSSLQKLNEKGYDSCRDVNIATNAEWGIIQFLPFIEFFRPYYQFDFDTDDQGIYFQFIAATYCMNEDCHHPQKDVITFDKGE